MSDFRFASPSSITIAPGPVVVKVRRRRWWWALAVGVLLTVMAVAALVVMYARAVYWPKASSGEMVAVTVAEGESVDQISNQLYQKGLLSQPLFFKIYLKLSGDGSKIQAGDFTIPAHISIQDLASRLGVAAREQVSLRFLEGWRREEMADYVDQQHQAGKISMTGAEFSDLALHPSVALQQELGDRLPADDSLQGFLFPDTYSVDKDETAEDVLKRMIDNYVKKVTPQMQQGFAAQGLSEYQAVTLASIVEREGRTADERSVIAGILLKRMNQGIALYTDATLQYALGYSDAEKTWWRKNLTENDLQLDSPYNTRTNAGLPPHPICNPGLDSLEAVAHPQESDYLYYMHGPDGQIHYAVTLEQHNANVAKYGT